jgi:hypothetical protein
VNVIAHSVPTTFNSSRALSRRNEQQRMVEGGEGRQLRDDVECEFSFRECFTRALGRIPPNRQYTEALDAADACAIQHCSSHRDDWNAYLRGNHSEDGRDTNLRALMRGTLTQQLDSHLSSVASGLKVPEGLLHCARILQLLGEGEAAARALKAAIRFVRTGTG